MILFGISLALLTHNEDVPITGRTRYAVIPESVEHSLSPLIRRWMERPLPIEPNTPARPKDRDAEGVLAELQRSLNRAAWEVIIIEDLDRVYATCGHDGALYITRRLLNYCRTESDLAWVLAHELSHGIARHRWEVAGKLSIYTLIAPVAGVVIAMTVSSLYGLSLVRSNELEADRMALILMSQAGYDPRAAVRFMQIFDTPPVATTPSRTVIDRLRNLPPLRTHPPNSIRVERLQTLVPEALSKSQNKTVHGHRIDI